MNVKRASLRLTIVKLLKSSNRGNLEAPEEEEMCMWSCGLQPPQKIVEPCLQVLAGRGVGPEFCIQQKYPLGTKSEIKRI